MKDEKEINIEKLGEINNLSNRNKQSTSRINRCIESAFT